MRTFRTGASHGQQNLLGKKRTKGGFSIGKKNGSCSLRGLFIVVLVFFSPFHTHEKQPFQNWYSSCLTELDFELHDE